MSRSKRSQSLKQRLIASGYKEDFIEQAMRSHVSGLSGVVEAGTGYRQWAKRQSAKTTRRQGQQYIFEFMNQ